MTLSRSKCRPIGASSYSVELLMSKRQNGVLFHVGSLQLSDNHACCHYQHAMRYLHELFRYPKTNQRIPKPYSSRDSCKFW